MSVFKQTSFVGGLDLLSERTSIPENAYEWGVNIRQRFGSPQPIKRPLAVETIPAGKKQGLVSVGNVLIAFVNGLAYFNIDGFDTWQQIPDFSMDTVVDRYYSIAVPSSSFNLQRKADSSGSANAPINVVVNAKVSGTPAGILVQDGVTQPWVIFWDEVNNFFYSRLTKNYDEWSNNTLLSREYVPIGKQMMILDEILFVVSRDGKSVYRSVTGRPLDFMIVVDINGNKAPSETIGGALQMSFAFDFDEITCIQSTNIPSSFIYGTANTVRIITIDRANTIFGEPRFYQSAEIDAGIVNQDSVVDIIGDTTFVDFENLTAFDAVRQLKFEGKNSIFSLMISSMLAGIKQEDPCCIAFDNYGLYNIDTIWGRLTAVYDMLLNKWVSLDITEIGIVRQFCIVTTSSITKLYCITVQDELYQIYGSTEYATGQLMSRSWQEGDARSETKTENVRTIFDAGVVNDATLRIREYIDEKKGQTQNRNLPVITAGITFPIIFPVIFDSKATVNNEAFTLDKGQAGSRVAVHLQWDNDAGLHELQITTQDVSADASLEQSQQSMTGTI